MANSRLCSIPDCGKPHLAKGFCNAHYLRMRTHGDPLGGGPEKTPRGEPKRFIDEIALSYEGKDCLTWPFSRTGNGYEKLFINGKLVRASRYVCECAHGAPPTEDHDAAHNCGKGHLGCVAPNHLEWKTCAENMQDKIEHGTHNRGVRNAQAKLTEKQVREIILMKGKKRQIDLAAAYGVTFQTISNIHRGKSWAWLADAS